LQKLIPLPVPWMVSPSTPNLVVTTGEGDDALVEFVGLFGAESEGARDLPPAHVMVAPAAPQLAPDLKSGRYQKVSIRFRTAGWVSRNAQHSDREVVDESLFDWSNVPGACHDGDPGTFRTRMQERWQKTGIAPNPGFYIVENSTWRTAQAQRWKLRHYLILGDQCSIDLLAQDFEWESKGRVLGW
jgi:hypothetical protein